ALRRVLEPAGLWEKKLPSSPDWHTKAALPEDDDLPEEIRKACREIATRKITWRLTTGEVEDGEEE
ncbi:MAG: hypothetical protein ACOC9H_01525, partial [Gemmatimonadota bacterium]